MDILTFFDIFLKPPQPFTGLFLLTPPASPDGKEEDNQGQRQERAATSPPVVAPGSMQQPQQQQQQQQKRTPPVVTPDSTTVNMEPSLEFNEPHPVAMEPTVVVVPYPGAPAPPPTPQKDSDCEIVDDPAVVAYKPKKDWAKKRMQQTKEDTDFRCTKV